MKKLFFTSLIFLLSSSAFASNYFYRENTLLMNDVIYENELNITGGVIENRRNGDKLIFNCTQPLHNNPDECYKGNFVLKIDGEYYNYYNSENLKNDYAIKHYLDSGMRTLNLTRYDKNRGKKQRVVGHLPFALAHYALFAGMPALVVVAAPVDITLLPVNIFNSIKTDIRAGVLRHRMKTLMVKEEKTKKFGNVRFRRFVRGL